MKMNYKVFFLSLILARFNYVYAQVGQNTVGYIKTSTIITTDQFRSFKPGIAFNAGFCVAKVMDERIAFFVDAGHENLRNQKFGVNEFRHTRMVTASANTWFIISPGLVVSLGNGLYYVMEGKTNARNEVSHTNKYQYGFSPEVIFNSGITNLTTSLKYTWTPGYHIIGVGLGLYINVN